MLIYLKGEEPATDVTISWPENSSNTTLLGFFLLLISKYNFVANHPGITVNIVKNNVIILPKKMLVK